MEGDRSKAICAKEALDLLNCVTDAKFDQEKCLRLLNALRTCVLEKKVKKFSLGEQSHNESSTSNQE